MFHTLIFILLYICNGYKFVNLARKELFGKEEFKCIFYRCCKMCWDWINYLPMAESYRILAIHCVVILYNINNILIAIHFEL